MDTGWFAMARIKSICTATFGKAISRALRRKRSDMEALSTQRLHLLPLTLADAPGIQRAFPKWEIVRWLDAAVPWPYPEDGAEFFLKNIALPAIERGEAWHWSIRPKEQANILIGVVSLMNKPDDNRGFWLDVGWQGQGLMTEASDMITNYWFETLDKEELRVPKAAGNIQSRRISEKQGMHLVSRFTRELVSGVHDMELWELHRDEWIKRN